jgi:hypothetical protein
MPYIDDESRENLLHFYPEKSGELNYVITKIIIEYLENKGRSYQHMNDIMGALEAAKLEFYRRVVAPYEDQKRKENGDVY